MEKRIRDTRGWQFCVGPCVKHVQEFFVQCARSVLLQLARTLFGNYLDDGVHAVLN